MTNLALSRWYGQLGPGVYQLSIKFILDNIEVESDTLAFEIIEPERAILSRDNTVAASALDKAILTKNKKLVRLGLKNPIFPIQQKAVEALAALEDKDSVSDLIEALRDNRGIIVGGTETDKMQTDLNRAIVTALKSITKLKFNVSDDLSAKDIEEVIKETEDWCKTNQSKP